MRVFVEAYGRDGRQILGNMDGQTAWEGKDYRRTDWYRALPRRVSLGNRVMTYRIVDGRHRVLETLRANFDYTQWLNQQAELVESHMRNLGRCGVYTASVYAFPSAGAIPGRLGVYERQPDACGMALEIPPHGKNVMMVPYSHLRSVLWDACRSAPILPTE